MMIGIETLRWFIRNHPDLLDQEDFDYFDSYVIYVQDCMIDAGYPI